MVAGSFPNNWRWTVQLVFVTCTLGAVHACSSGDDGQRQGSGGSTSTQDASESGDALGELTDASSGTAEIGATCNSDADCVAGLECVGSDAHPISQLRIAHGLCSVGCSADAGICNQFGPNTFCEELGDAGSNQLFCVEKCVFGPLGSVDTDPSKCHGRPDMMCYGHLEATTSPCNGVTSCGENQICDVNGMCADVTPLCKPRCNRDADCPSSFYCMLSSGLCAPSKPIGDPIGASCDPSSNNCQGRCLQGGGVSFCSASCTYGVAAACGWDGAGAASAACLGKPVAVASLGGPGLGDEGLCVQLCDCAADCLAPNFACDRLTTSKATAYGRAGGCVPQAYVLDPISCGPYDAGSD